MLHSLLINFICLKHLLLSLNSKAQRMDHLRDCLPLIEVLSLLIIESNVCQEYVIFIGPNTFWH